MFKVRPAEVSDAPRIVQILRAEFSPDLLPYTIFGCRGIERYIRDVIAHQDLGDSTWYVLCREHADVLGFTEIRRAVDGLLLSYCYIVPSARGPGIGTSLLFHGITRARTLSHSRVELDVFHDNYTVRRGHRAAGFEEVRQTLWVELGQGDWSGEETEEWYAVGLAMADRIHENYDFSEFALQTRSNSYRIGRLGADLFRATDAALLLDPAVPHALRTLDRRRSLLCIDKEECISRTIPKKAVVRARSFRMAADLDTVLERLSRFLVI